MAIILIPKLTGKYLKIFPKIEKIIFLLHTLLLDGRLDLTKTSSNSSFSHRQLKVLKPHYRVDDRSKGVSLVSETRLLSN